MKDLWLTDTSDTCSATDSITDTYYYLDLRYRGTSTTASYSGPVKVISKKQRTSGPVKVYKMNYLEEDQEEESSVEPIDRALDF
jgi:hypothetical protein